MRAALRVSPVSRFNGSSCGCAAGRPASASRRQWSAAPVAMSLGVTIGRHVDDTEKVGAIYKDVIGVDVKTDAAFLSDPSSSSFWAERRAVPRERRRAPRQDSAAAICLIKGVDRKPLHPEVADPNSILLRSMCMTK